MTISAKVIADSISTNQNRITTFELEYPRFIHAEFMTHRLFSRNAASSRAIPVAKAFELILEDTARPIHWGKNQPGMSAKEECDAKYTMVTPTGIEIHLSREEIWQFASKDAIKWAERFNELGYHKQIVNRLLEPFTHIKVVCTATEYDNFFWLRCHPDAQPEIQELAEKMWQAYKASTPAKLNSGDWHVPYYKNGQWFDSGYATTIDLEAVDDKRGGNTLQEAIAISASCCAQVSYRRLDDSLEKALDIYERLVDSKPVHASPFEHQATPMLNPEVSMIDPWHGLHRTQGVTHLDGGGNYWSGNFQGWIQNRQLIPQNACWDYNEDLG